MNLSNFNFAQPWWLLGLLLIPIGWLWYRYGQNFNKAKISSLERFADPKLLPHLLLVAEQTKRNTSSQGWLYASLIACLVLSLANPRWNFKEIDAYAPTASMVILMDLGASMSNIDVSPSRIIRARQNVEDLLNQSRGLKVGLLGFAAIPHLISPITDDVQTVKAFLPAIDTTLITKQGDALNLALTAAEELLDTEPGDKKSILLVSDGNFADIDYAPQLKDLRSKNIMLFVMGVGTSVNQAKLQTIAKDGNGIYVHANHSEADLQKILAKAQNLDSSKQIVSGKIKQWEDRYYLLLLPAVLIFLYMLSQRAFYSLFAIIAVGLCNSPSATAFELRSVFQNSEQQAEHAFQRTNFSEAASLFKDRYRKGVALYRSGDFAAAEQQFKSAQRPEVKISAMYNAGNAQMQQKKWRAAISSYEHVLQDKPDHIDAKHNLEIARKMLAENDNKQDDQPKEQPKDEKQDKQDKQDTQDKKDAQDNKDNKDNKHDKPDNQDNKSDNKQENKPENKPEPPKPAMPFEDIDAPIQTSKAEASEQEARAQQWLNRIDSDIRIFLKNKFYIEDMLSTK